MANVAVKIINAVAASYNGGATIKTGKSYQRDQEGNSEQVAATLVSALNSTLSIRYSGVNWT